MKDTAQTHGSIPYAELRDLRIPVSTVIDFSATVNPFPLPEAIQDLFTCDGIAAYPDPECYEAKHAIAGFHEIPEYWVLVAAGLTEVLFALPKLYKRAICFVPTYGDYAAAYRQYRKEIREIPFPDSDFEWEKTLDKMQSSPFRLLIICNPNNPTGQYIPPWKIEELCQIFGHATICIDESYQEMSDACETVLPLTTRFRNVLILKSLTKPFGIGGLRAGYAVSSGGVIKRLLTMMLPWNVSSIVQRVIPALFQHYEYFSESWRQILEERDTMSESLGRSGLLVRKNRTPFLLVKVRDAERIRKHFLVNHKIAIRSCVSFGMPEWIRIMPGRPEHNRYFIDNLQDVIW